MVHDTCFNIIEFLRKELLLSSLEDDEKITIDKELSRIGEKTLKIQHSHWTPAEEQLRQFTDLLVQLAHIGTVIKPNFVFPYHFFVLRSSRFTAAVIKLHELMIRYQSKNDIHDQVTLLSLRYCVLRYWDQLFGTSKYKSERCFILDNLDQITLEISDNQLTFRDFIRITS